MKYGGMKIFYKFIIVRNCDLVLVIIIYNRLLMISKT